MLAAAVVVAGWGAQANTITYYHNDGAGTPLAATSSSGQVVWRESYRPYGERLTNSAAANGNDVWFTSRRQDESGLVYMGARYYDPTFGRFLSVDPRHFDGMDLHSHNRYAYANNNPLRYKDPNGAMAQLVLRATYVAAFETATWLGAAQVGSALAGLLWTLNEGADAEKKPNAPSAEPAKESKGAPHFPDRQLPRDEHGRPAPDAEAEGPYSQLGQRDGRKGKYDQAREFDAEGKPVRDVDFTDHGRPNQHPSPHQHVYRPSPTGGTPSRGDSERLP
jgi:RHS repeat-associated protein